MNGQRGAIFEIFIAPKRLRFGILFIVLCYAIRSFNCLDDIIQSLLIPIALLA